MQKIFSCGRFFILGLTLQFSTIGLAENSTCANFTGVWGRGYCQVLDEPSARVEGSQLVLYQHECDTLRVLNWPFLAQTNYIGFFAPLFRFDQVSEERQHFTDPLGSYTELFNRQRARWLDPERTLVETQESFGSIVEGVEGPLISQTKIYSLSGDQLQVRDSLDRPGCFYERLPAVSP